MSDAGSGPGEDWPSPPPPPPGSTPPPPPPGAGAGGWAGGPQPPQPPAAPGTPAPRYGYGGPAYAAPQYGAPGYGMPVQQGPKTSGLAIASLVLGVLWVCGVGSLLALILGIVALLGIKSSKGMLTGKGMAIAGVVLGAVGVIATIGFWIVVATSADDVGNQIVDVFCEAQRKSIETAVDRFEAAEGRPPADEQELIDAGYLSFDSDAFDVVDGRVIAKNECA